MRSQKASVSATGDVRVAQEGEGPSSAYIRKTPGTNVRAEASGFLRYEGARHAPAAELALEGVAVAQG